MGTCIAGVCVGPYAPEIVGSNTDNEPCLAGYCQAQFTDSDIVLTDTTNYPSISCNPLCPAWPACSDPSDQCSGWPTVNDTASLLSVLVYETDLDDGEECRFPSRCVLAATCDGGECTPTITRDPVCRRTTCMECNPLTGVCDGPSVPAGAECKAGCVASDILGETIVELGTCDGAGVCEGDIPFPDDFCVQQQVFGELTNPINDPCYETACVAVDLGFKVPGNPVPFIDVEQLATGDEQAVEIDSIVGELSSCSLVATFALCDDGNNCTLGDACDADFFCSATLELDSFCQYTQCLQCNPATGACDPALEANGICFTPCAPEASPFGFCRETSCIPFAVNTTVCAAFSPDLACTTAECATEFVDAGPPVPVENNRTITYAEVAEYVAADCSTSVRADGLLCSTPDGSANPCIVAETCQSGMCVVDTVVGCGAVVTGAPCVNASATVCNPESGVCEPLFLPNGTACDTQSSCFTDGMCVDGGCAGTPVLDCGARVTPGNCIVASECDGSGASPRCVDTLAPDGLPCVPDSATVCGPSGECAAGVCEPIPAFCPGTTDQCMEPFCDAVTGCGIRPVDDGTPCDDGDLCTVNDRCDAGACSAEPVTCEPRECQISNGCVDGVCDYDLAPDGTPCDGGACDEGLCAPVCDPPCENGGVCVNSDPRECECPFGLTGAFCQTPTASIMDDLEISIRAAIDDVLGVTLMLIAFIIIISLFVGFLCVYLRPVPEIRAVVPVDKTL